MSRTSMQMPSLNEAAISVPAPIKTDFIIQSCFRPSSGAYKGSDFILLCHINTPFCKMWPQLWPYLERTCINVLQAAD